MSVDQVRDGVSVFFCTEKLKLYIQLVFLLFRLTAFGKLAVAPVLLFVTAVALTYQGRKIKRTDRQVWLIALKFQTLLLKTHCSLNTLKCCLFKPILLNSL